MFSVGFGKAHPDHALADLEIQEKQLVKHLVQPGRAFPFPRPTTEVAARNRLDLGTLSEMVDCAFDPGSGSVLNSVHAAPLESVLPVKLVTPG
jgi:hypothetical protein